MSECRWVVLRVTVQKDGGKASEILGPDISAPDRPTAIFRARQTYPALNGEIAVVSRLSWDMSTEEREQMDRRSKVHLGALYRRGGPPKKG